MKRLVGSSICVSSPGPQYQPPSSVSLAPITATAAAPVPSNARDMSNRECGLWYQVGTGDYCNLLVLRFGISLPDFIFLNPTINSNCTNLLLGIHSLKGLDGTTWRSDCAVRCFLLCQARRRYQQLQRPTRIYRHDNGRFIHARRKSSRWQHNMENGEAHPSSIGRWNKT
jgi:hypothetical protein